MRNTKERAIFTLFIYRSKQQYIGVCLELDIVDNGTDPRELENRMKKSVESYVKRICTDNRFDERFLNRRAPKKYWDIFFRYLENLKKLQEIEPLPSTSVRPRRDRISPVNDFILSRQNLQNVCSV